MELNLSANNKFLNAKIGTEEQEEMNKNYYSNSEIVFNTTWDLTVDQNFHLETDDKNNDKIVKSLYKELSKLNIQNISSEEEDSSVDTIIHKEVGSISRRSCHHSTVSSHPMGVGV